MWLWQENSLERACLPCWLESFTSVRTQIKWVKCLSCLCSCSSASLMQTCSFLSVSSLGQNNANYGLFFEKRGILPHKREVQYKMWVVMCLFCDIPVNDVCSQVTVLGRSCRAVPLGEMASGACSLYRPAWTRAQCELLCKEHHHLSVILKQLRDLLFGSWLINTPNLWLAFHFVTIPL